MVPYHGRRDGHVTGAVGATGSRTGGMVRSVLRQVMVAGIGAALLLQLAGWTRVEAQTSVDIDVQAFAYQLAYPKAFDARHTAATLTPFGIEVPPVLDYYERVVRWCVETNWGAPS